MKIKKIAASSLFAALICVATIVMPIPLPTGYINFGDCFVLLSAWLLGPAYGALASGIGSALADIISGFPVYAPGTLVIKALMAVSAALIFRVFKKSDEVKVLPLVLSALVSEIIMVVGYMLYEMLISTSELAAILNSVPGNSIQGLAAIISSVLIMKLFSASGILKKYLQ